MSRNILARLGAPVAVILVVLASACGGGGEEDSDVEREQFFATDPFGLEPGLAIVKMTHQGKGNFVVNLLSARQEETARAPAPIKFSGGQNGEGNAETSIALVDETGPINISRAVNIPAAGKHLFDVKADGPWTIEVEQPRPSSAPKKTSFTGGDDAATDFFELSSGVKTISLTTLTSASAATSDETTSDEKVYGFSLLNEDGNVAEVSVLDQGEVRSDSGWTTTWLTVEIPEEGIYLLGIRAEGLWSVEIAEGEQPAVSEQPRSINILGMSASRVIGLFVVPIVLGIIIFWGLKGRARKHPGET